MDTPAPPPPVQPAPGELLDAIYEGFPPGLPPPDPVALVRQWKHAWDEHTAQLAAQSIALDELRKACRLAEGQRDAARGEARRNPAVAMLQRILAYCQARGLDRRPEEDIADMTIRHLAGKEGA